MSFLARFRRGSQAVEPEVTEDAVRGGSGGGDARRTVTSDHCRAQIDDPAVDFGTSDVALRLNMLWFRAEAVRSALPGSAPDDDDDDGSDSDSDSGIASDEAEQTWRDFALALGAVDDTVRLVMAVVVVVIGHTDVCVCVAQDASSPNDAVPLTIPAAVVKALTARVVESHMRVSAVLDAAVRVADTSPDSRVHGRRADPRECRRERINVSADAGRVAALRDGPTSRNSAARCACVVYCRWRCDRHSSAYDDVPHRLGTRQQTPGAPGINASRNDSSLCDTRTRARACVAMRQTTLPADEWVPCTPARPWADARAASPDALAVLAMIVRQHAYASFTHRRHARARAAACCCQTECCLIVLHRVMVDARNSADARSHCTTASPLLIGLLRVLHVRAIHPLRRALATRNPA